MNKFLIGALALTLAVSCASNSGKTVIKGSFSSPDAPTSVAIGHPALDTTIALENGKFSVEIPVDKMTAGQIQVGDNVANFISDGTTLTVKMAGDGIVVVSDNPKQSVTSRLQSMEEEAKALGLEYRSGMQAIAQRTDVSDDEKNGLMEEFYSKCIKKSIDSSLKAISENNDNIIAIEALKNIYYEMSDPQLDSLLSTLDPTVLSTPLVEKITKGVKARQATAEGNMFSDFTIPQPDGTQASLSDYVGKGKYVLVDFWASWCGPCKRQIPYIKAAYEKFAGKDFDVLSVAVWDKPQASVDTAAAYKVNWHHIIDAQTIPTDIYGISGIPQIILFGPDGTIVKRNLHGDAISEEVAKYIDKN